MPAVTVAALAKGIFALAPTTWKDNASNKTLILCIREVLTESSVVSPGGGCGGREAGTLLLELARRALEFAGVVVRGVGHPSTGGETSIRTWPCVVIFIAE